MRHLALLALVAFAALPLSAHEHWRGPRRIRVVTAAFPPYRSCYSDHRERPGCPRRYGWDEFHGWRSLTPPFRENGQSWDR